MLDAGFRASCATMACRVCVLRSILLTVVAVAAFRASAARAELPDVLRVVTYNIHHGEGIDGKFDLARLAKVMLAAKPDIIAVQEVDQGTQRSSGVDQPAELARLIGMKAVFGRNIDFEGGGYGTLVLTNLPIRSHESVKLKSFYAPTNENPEQRGVQVLELGDEDEPRLWFLCTHLDYRPPDDERMASAATINKLIQERGDELAIIAGDFNATPDSRVIAEFAKVWRIAGLDRAQDIRTSPGDKPDKWIDYVMCRPAKSWEVAEVRVLDEAVASDHRPLLAVLRRIR
jgi:endonuclease/exonuclease/phosphatase family metal-dependent hydrolase